MKIGPACPIAGSSLEVAPGTRTWARFGIPARDFEARLVIRGNLVRRHGPKRRTRAFTLPTVRTAQVQCRGLVVLVGRSMGQARAVTYRLGSAVPLMSTGRVPVPTDTCSRSIGHPCLFQQTRLRGDHGRHVTRYMGRKIGYGASQAAART